MDIREIKGVGEKTEKLFWRLGIRDTDQLLEYYPRGYDVYEPPVYIREFDNRAVVAIAGIMTKNLEVKRVRNLQIVTGYIRDGQDSVLKVTWFNMPFLRNSIKAGFHFILRGRLNRKGRVLTLEQPEVFSPDVYEKKVNAMQPIYGLTAGLTNKAVQKAVGEVLRMGKYEREYLPEAITKKFGLCAYEDAIYNIHFPKDKKLLLEARRRLVFDEFFLFITTFRRLKENKAVEKNTHVIKNFEKEEAFLSKLPYELTGAQKRVWGEVKKDLAGESAMNRLIQGDVGSGKTVIAMLALLAMSDAGFQGAMMAPTEVLAKQHYMSFLEMNETCQLGIHPVLLTGSMSAGEKRTAYESIACGYADIVIGTHALIQDKVEFHNLGLVITDEQHRFGVRQREMLAAKGENVHIMVMSATPIPRTLAIILYGGLDISVIDELPANRLPIKNCVLGKSYRKKVYRFIEEQVKQQHQIYIICPMVEESDNLEGENVISYAKMLSEQFPPSIVVEYLHGKMKPALKNEIMERFARNEIQVLVSTTVVEVGINVPNATVMMVENAERFGLAALHQLRGRVGRGDSQSYCIFLSTSDKEETMERLRILNTSNDGFYIASQDMKLRGTGDFFGIRQSGDMEFKLGDIYQDGDMIQYASEAVKLIESGEVFVSDEEELAMMAKIEKYHRYAAENINL